MKKIINICLLMSAMIQGAATKYVPRTKPAEVYDDLIDINNNSRIRFRFLEDRQMLITHIANVKVIAGDHTACRQDVIAIRAEADDQMVSMLKEGDEMLKKIHNLEVDLVVANKTKLLNQTELNKKIHDYKMLNKDLQAKIVELNKQLKEKTIKIEQLTKEEKGVVIAEHQLAGARELANEAPSVKMWAKFVNLSEENFKKAVAELDAAQKSLAAANKQVKEADFHLSTCRMISGGLTLLSGASTIAALIYSGTSSSTIKKAAQQSSQALTAALVSGATCVTSGLAYTGFNYVQGYLQNALTNIQDTKNEIQALAENLNVAKEKVKH